jgi:hypothetical protein
MGGASTRGLWTACRRGAPVVVDGCGALSGFLRGVYLHGTASSTDERRARLRPQAVLDLV